MPEIPKLISPRVRRIKLNRFSLFSLQPDIEVAVPDGILCLAGANGIGKSTFLTAVGYGMTGIVPNPSRNQFKTVERYYQDALRFSNDFFAGRISEEDRDVASIDLDLVLDDQLFEITRGLFEPQELRAFSVSKVDTGEEVFSGADRTPRERDQEYRARLTSKMGLKSFEQFAFLHNFVLTFDERRELLLWNADVLLQAIFLAIGADRQKAERADYVRQERQRQGSWGRNLQWQASRLKKEIDKLRRTIPTAEEEKTVEEIREQYNRLVLEVAHKQQEIGSKKAELRDVELRRTEELAKLASLHDEYSDTFARHLHMQSRIELHPTVKTSIAGSECSVCGASGQAVVQAIKVKIESGHCPLCGSVVTKEDGASPDLDELRLIDQQISETKKRLGTSEKTKTRILGELGRADVEAQGVRAQVQNIESENDASLLKAIPRSKELETITAAKEAEYWELRRQSDEAYKQRDQWQIELVSLYDELRQRYNEAQTEFVPMFRELAHLFIGVDMDIRMDYSTSVSSTGIHLFVEMQGTMRREMHQLSESQRFFLDIALRMALAKYMSNPRSKAPLFIDTPEGSLDIAYEARAGEMFARFAESGHNIVMTANINTSQLLQKMAFRCGKNKMRLEKMTSWGMLSDVQQEEAELFRSAYDEIEKKLEAGGGVKNG